jgi:hypothetical protein
MRNAILKIYDQQWLDARIPYTISEQYTTLRCKLYIIFKHFYFVSLSIIIEAINELQAKTCIRIEPKTDADKDYVYIFPGNGCYSNVGRIGIELSLITVIFSAALYRRSTASFNRRRLYLEIDNNS